MNQDFHSKFNGTRMAEILDSAYARNDAEGGKYNPSAQVKIMMIAAMEVMLATEMLKAGGKYHGTILQDKFMTFCTLMAPECFKDKDLFLKTMRLVHDDMLAMAKNR